MPKVHRVNYAGIPIEIVDDLETGLLHMNRGRIIAQSMLDDVDGDGDSWNDYIPRYSGASPNPSMKIYLADGQPRVKIFAPMPPINTRMIPPRQQSPAMDYFVPVYDLFDSEDTLGAFYICGMPKWNVITWKQLQSDQEAPLEETGVRKRVYSPFVEDDEEKHTYQLDVKKLARIDVEEQSDFVLDQNIFEDPWVRPYYYDPYGPPNDPSWPPDPPIYGYPYDDIGEYIRTDRYILGGIELTKTEFRNYNRDLIVYEYADYSGAIYSHEQWFSNYDRGTQIENIAYVKDAESYRDFETRIECRLTWNEASEAYGMVYGAFFYGTWSWLPGQNPDPPPQSEIYRKDWWSNHTPRTQSKVIRCVDEFHGTYEFPIYTEDEASDPLKANLRAIFMEIFDYQGSPVFLVTIKWIEPPEYEGPRDDSITYNMIYWSNRSGWVREQQTYATNAEGRHAVIDSYTKYGLLAKGDARVAKVDGRSLNIITGVPEWEERE